MVDLDRLRHVTDAPWMDPCATCIVSNGTFKFPIKQLTMFSWLVESPTCFFYLNRLLEIAETLHVLRLYAFLSNVQLP